jgi:DNA ligase (NAD+)
MTDAQYDAALDTLTDADPTNPFFEQVGAPPATGDEVLLPIPLPSLSKIKAADDTLTKWLSRNLAKHYHVSNKLDGCSALWIPATRKLYTRGDGVKGRDISHLAPHFTGFPAAAGADTTAVRGELIMFAASPAIPADKIARNVVAGALNRKEVDKALFAEIRFVAYELIVSGPQQPSPMDSTKLLYAAGYETAHVVLIPATKMTETYLSALFTHSEAASRYQIDGVVVAPNLPRVPQPRLRKGQALNPTDCVAWKTRQVATTARTTVRSVEWNISMTGYLIPRVLFDPVVLSGATISAATGLHGRWIYENKVGPGASIEIRRAGDVIPQIIAVHASAPAGPSMPQEMGGWQWMGAAETAVHIGPTAATDPAAANKARLSHALAELGAENVGPGIVAKLYAAGFTTLKAIYAASVSELAARVEGVKAASAERIWNGLRAKQGTWTEVTLMYASCTMPRGVGHSKLTPLLAMNPDPATWSAAAFKMSRPAGLSDKTIDEIVAAVPAYLAWRLAAAPQVQALQVQALQAVAPVAAAAAAPSVHSKVIVFTGGRDKTLEAALQAAGHQVADAVTKKTTHIAYPDGPEPSSTKITKAREMGIAILSASALRAEFHIAH